MAKLKNVDTAYKRYIKLYDPVGFNDWVDGVLNNELNKLEK